MKYWIQNLFLSVLFCFGFLSLCHGKDVVLFNNALPVPRYNELINGLEVGDVLTFEDGTRFRYHGRLGRGSTSNIFDVSADFLDTNLPPYFALRVPLAYPNHEYNYPDFIDYTMDGLPALEELSIPIPQIYRHLSKRYIAIQKIQGAFNLDHFFLDPGKMPADMQSYMRNVPESIRGEANIALDVFAKQMAYAGEIGDFRFDQVQYDTELKAWILIDWTHANKERPHIFQHALGRDTRIGFFKVFKEKYLRPGALRRMHELEHIVRRARGDKGVFLRCYDLIRIIGLTK